MLYYVSMIVCPLCQAQFKSLQSHVLYKHKLRTTEFRLRFPNTSMVATEVRTLTSHSCKQGGCGKWRRGQKLPAQAIENLSRRSKGQNNPFFGHRHSATTRRKMSKNHADFRGNNNPLRRALADPAKRERYSAARRAIWAELKRDTTRYNRFRQRLSKAMAQAHIEGRLQGYGRGHRTGYVWVPSYGHIYYRSSYEKRFIEWCLRKGHTIRPCNFTIAYKQENCCLRYLPDFLVDNNLLVEVKPSRLAGTVKNRLKARAARRYCKKRGWKFKVITEAFLDSPTEL